MINEVSLDDSENDCILKGRELKAAIRGAGMRVAKQATAAFGPNVFFLERAVGLLACTMFCKAGQKRSFKPENWSQNPTHRDLFSRM